MTTKLEKGFLIIPKEIVTLTKVNGKLFGFAEKALYSYLLHWSSTSDKVFPSTRRICKDLGIGSRNSITKYLHKLEDLNLLLIKRSKGKSSEYTVLTLESNIIDKPKESVLVRGTNRDVKEEQQKEVNTQEQQGQSLQVPDTTSPWDYDFDDLDNCPF